jgi:hypothetical protein
VDGDFGPDTTKALQWRVGVTQSGVWGAETTKGLQRMLNANTFWPVADTEPGRGPAHKKRPQ